MRYSPSQVSTSFECNHEGSIARFRQESFLSPRCRCRARGTRPNRSNWRKGRSALGRIIVQSAVAYLSTMRTKNCKTCISIGHGRSQERAHEEPGLATEGISSQLKLESYGLLCSLGWEQVDEATPRVVEEELERLLDARATRHNF